MCEEELLLLALRAGIRGEKVCWNGRLDPASGEKLLELARAHHVQALVLDAIYGCPDFACLDSTLRTSWKQEAKSICIRQTLRDDAFGAIWSKLEKGGIAALVMKGCVCRNLYPNPGLRPSSDEDILVKPEDFSRALQLFRELGFTPREGEASPDAFEVGLISRQGLYIELHQSPFAPGSATVWNLENYFDGVHDGAMQVTTAAGAVLTMSAHDHMLYLLLHAFKHFIHSGFGVRQVCDIALWAERYGEQIRWPLLFEQCAAPRCDRFAKTVFAAATKYLGFDGEKAGIAEYLSEDLPADALLEDMLGAGVFGSSTGSRVHSATITLNTVEANRKGKKSSTLRTVFPKRHDLQGRYPYLRKWPVLLPVAWCSRLGSYVLETGKKNNSAAESLDLGAKRKELLRSLDIIE